MDFSTEIVYKERMLKDLDVNTAELLGEQARRAIHTSKYFTQFDDTPVDVLQKLFLPSDCAVELRQAFVKGFEG